jgi:hypothetical protein
MITRYCTPVALGPRPFAGLWALAQIVHIEALVLDDLARFPICFPNRYSGKRALC